MLRPSTVRSLARAQRRVPQTQLSARRTLFTTKRSSPLSSDFDLNRLSAKRRDYEANRTAFLTAGAIAGIVSFIYTAWKLKEALDVEKEKGKLSIQAESPIPNQTFKTEAGEKRKIVVHDDEGREIVPTGNSVVPAFPRLIEVTLAEAPELDNSIAASISNSEGTEFTLVGLGTRTVTFLGIQVYVVGFYVATQDIAQLQHYLVKKVNSMATTLIPSEKDTLRKSLKDAKEGEETWNAILADSKIRSIFRITPVRDTDFHHLRDGFVRAITGRSQGNTAYDDERFGAAMKDFKGMFSRGSIPKKQEMLLCRDQVGKLTVLYGEDEAGKSAKKETLGVISDERLSRLLWLNYLAGNKVAAEKARDNIIEGVMEFVERPVGTVATQVI